MELRFQYRLQRSDLMALSRILLADEHRAAVRQNRWTGLLWVGMLAAGMYAAHEAGLRLLLWILAGGMVGYLFGWWRFGANYWDGVRASIVVPEDTVDLMAGEEGFRTRCGEVELSAPWSAVVRVIEQEERWFVEFGANEWLVLPTGRIDPGSDQIEVLRRLLPSARPG